MDIIDDISKGQVKELAIVYPEKPMSRKGTGIGSLFRNIESIYGRVPFRLPRSARDIYFRVKYTDELDKFEYPPDPFKSPEVSPDEIQRFTGRPHPPYRNKIDHLGSVHSGDWDRTRDVEYLDDSYKYKYNLYRDERFCDSVFFESMRDHFVHGVPWEDTEFVNRCLSHAAAGRPTWHHQTTEEGILERCEKVDKLYEDIQEKGYLSQREQDNDLFKQALDEVCVDIARDGTFLFVNGRHRLAIAKILGLDRIPVNVLVRHEDWMEKRDRVGRSISNSTPLPDDGFHGEHPDLQDLYRR